MSDCLEILQSWVYKIKHKNLSECIDWRYKLSNKRVAVSIPGADIWDLAIFLAFFNSLKKKHPDFDYNRYDILIAFLELVGWVENFSFHTDDKHLDTNYCLANVDNCIWCWHIYNELYTPWKYWLNQDDISFLLKTISWLDKNWANNEVLRWKHAEEAVLIVHSFEYWIYHSFLDPSWNNRQFFVFTPETIRARHSRIIDILFDKWIFSSFFDKNEILDKIDDITQKHLNNTAEMLAKWKKIIHVNFDENWIIQFV